MGRAVWDTKAQKDMGYFLMISSSMSRLLEDVYVKGRDSYSLDEKKISEIIETVQIATNNGSLDALLEMCSQFRLKILSKT